MITPYIYGLVDPRDHRVRYVGKSFRHWSSTLGRHIDGALQQPVTEWDARNRGWQTPKHVWIRELFSLDLEPYILKLADSTPETLSDDEKRFIAEYRERYPDLTNANAGGQGGQRLRYKMWTPA